MILHDRGATKVLRDCYRVLHSVEREARGGKGAKRQREGNVLREISGYKSCKVAGLHEQVRRWVKCET